MVHVVDERGWTMEGGVKVSCMIPTYVPIVEFFLTLILVCGGWHQNPYNTIAVNRFEGMAPNTAPLFYELHGN